MHLMKLLTYNIHYWQGADGMTDVDRIVAVIRSTGADIVGLNEVYHPAKVKGLSLPALEYMAAELGMYYDFGQAQAFGSGASPTDRSLSIDPARVLATPCCHAGPFLPRLPIILPRFQGMTRVACSKARILLPDKQTTLTVYVTHLDAESEEARLTQAQALLTWTGRDRLRPHVLMGDLNAYNPDDYISQPGGI